MRLRAGRLRAAIWSRKVGFKANKAHPMSSSVATAIADGRSRRKYISSALLAAAVWRRFRMRLSRWQ